METQKEQQEFIQEITDNTNLNTDRLKEYGFVMEKSDYTEYHEEIYNFNGVDIHYDTESEICMFCTYVRGNGYMKSGFSLKTIGRLKACYYGITGKMLEKFPIENKL